MIQLKHTRGYVDVAMQVNKDVMQFQDKISCELVMSVFTLPGFFSMGPLLSGE